MQGRQLVDMWIRIADDGSDDVLLDVPLAAAFFATSSWGEVPTHAFVRGPWNGEMEDR